MVRNLKILEFEALKKIENAIFRNLAVAKIHQISPTPNDEFSIGRQILTRLSKVQKWLILQWSSKNRKN